MNEKDKGGETNYSHIQVKRLLLKMKVDKLPQILEELNNIKNKKKFFFYFSITQEEFD